MTTSEKICLKWNDFKENISSAFVSLREDKDFADVTLVCEDGHHVEAHKVILAASSPFFQHLFSVNKHAHPLIYMRGMKSDDLVAIVDFLYHGETNICQENLDYFLAIAAELKLKGLTGSSQVTKQGNPILNIPKTTYYSKDINALNIPEKSDQITVENEHESRFLSENIVSVSDFKVVSSDLQDLDKKVKSMMRVGEYSAGGSQGRVRICNICGKEGNWTNIRDHIEANHIRSIVRHCTSCGKTFMSRTSLRKHKSAYHKHEVQELQELNHIE